MMPRRLNEKQALGMWVVYDRPRDFPDKVIARLWQISLGKLKATKETIVGDSLDEVRDGLPDGLYRMERQPEDDPNIVEVWF